MFILWFIQKPKLAKLCTEEMESNKNVWLSGINKLTGSQPTSKETEEGKEEEEGSQVSKKFKPLKQSKFRDFERYIEESFWTEEKKTINTKINHWKFKKEMEEYEIKNKSPKNRKNTWYITMLAKQKTLVPLQIFWHPFWVLGRRWQ